MLSSRGRCRFESGIPSLLLISAVFIEPMLWSKLMEMRLKQAVPQVYFSGGRINTALPANINTTFIQSDLDFNNSVLKTLSIHRSQCFSHRMFVHGHSSDVTFECSETNCNIQKVIQWNVPLTFT